MAHIFGKPGKKTWWACYYLNDKRVRHSLRTKQERIAQKKLKKIELDLLMGELDPKTVTPLKPFLEAFSIYLATVRSATVPQNPRRREAATHPSPGLPRRFLL